MERLKPYQTRTDFWLQFALLYCLTIVAQFSNIAYEQMAKGEALASFVLPSLIFLSVLTIPSLLIGLKLGKGLGLGLVNSEDSQSGLLKNGIKFAVMAAIPLGFALLAVRWGLNPYLPAEVPEYGFRGPIGGLLVSFGAGVGEEVWFRFGLMTLLLYLYVKVFKANQLSNTAVLLVILFAGVCFGLAHLPQLISYGAGSTFSMWGTVLGNLAVSTLYGWCFWRYGLVSAIVAHFSVDIVLHVLPAFF